MACSVAAILVQGNMNCIHQGNKGDKFTKKYISFVK